MEGGMLYSLVLVDKKLFNKAQSYLSQGQQFRHFECFCPM